MERRWKALHGAAPPDAATPQTRVSAAAGARLIGGDPQGNARDALAGDRENRGRGGAGRLSCEGAGRPAGQSGRCALRGTVDRVRARRAALALAVWAVFTATWPLRPSGATEPLAVRISETVPPGQGKLAFVVMFIGLEPDAPQTLASRISVGSTEIVGPPSAVAHLPSRLPIVVDFVAGRITAGGVSVGRFPPVPPIDENTPVALDVTLGQHSQTATARWAGMWFLPTVVVPGYLNELSGKPNPSAVTVLERRGLRISGPSPNVFWFNYRSRRLSLDEGARELAAYVRDTVLPATHAARINVVGYSEGGLLARWNLAFEPGWDRLVNRLILVATPNEGAVLSYVYAWYPIGVLARTRAARDLLPTFAFWRPDPQAPWSVPPDAPNPALTALNAHPLPSGIRAYALYGSRDGTESGVIGRFPEPGFSYGPGDGIVLKASVLGLPVNGDGGVPGLAGQFVATIDLGPQKHMGMLGAAMPKIADILMEKQALNRSRSAETEAEPPAPWPLAAAPRSDVAVPRETRRDGGSL